MRCLLPAMPVVTLAGSEEDGMCRGGRARPRRQCLYEVDVNGLVDLTDEDWWWLEGLPALGAAPPEDVPLENPPQEDGTPPEDAPGEANDPPEVEPIEVDLGEFLATHTATDEQIALLHQFITGAGDPATIWENLLASMMNSIALSVAEEADSN
jgi:hypothetical protein